MIIHYSVPTEFGGVKSTPLKGATPAEILKILSVQDGGRFKIACGERWQNERDVQGGVVRQVSGEAISVTCEDCQKSPLWQKAMVDWVRGIDDIERLPPGFRIALGNFVRKFGHLLEGGNDTPAGESV